MTPDPAEGDRLLGAPHPRERAEFIGHADIEAELLSAWRSGRFPHALLLGGPEGVGKATLAYRLARFVLAGGDANAETLKIDTDHPVFHQVAALSHPDLLALRRLPSDEGKALSKFIRVDDMRRVTSFLGSTAAYGGWRVCIVDAAEDMNRESANAILKLLEEPPGRSLFILVSHAPGRLLPTIRSRCRRIEMNALSLQSVGEALNSLGEELPDIQSGDVPGAVEASQGSVRRALSFLLEGGESLDVLTRTRALLGQLPNIDSASIAALGDKLRGDNLEVFSEAVTDWLAAAATGDGTPARLARYAEAWENVRRATAAAETYNLDRKPLAFQVFAVLADATRE